MSSNGTFTTNTSSLNRPMMKWGQKESLPWLLHLFCPTKGLHSLDLSIYWTSILYWGHLFSRKSPATHLEDERTKRNAVNEKPWHGQATGPVALGLGRADIIIVNDNPLFVRAIGLLSKIRVFDIRVGSLIRASKPPCCHLSWIGCIRL